MNNIPTDEQYKAGFYRLPRPGEHFGDLRFVDWFIPRLHLTIGILLMIGLFTRPSAIAAALFLLSVIVTQPYWLPNPINVQYQVVEFLAVLAVAAVGAGKWFGVDAFLVAAYRQWIAKKKGPSHEPNA